MSLIKQLWIGIIIMLLLVLGGNFTGFPFQRGELVSFLDTLVQLGR